MNRKPTRRELAMLMSDDDQTIVEQQYGMPMAGNQPGVSPDTYNAAPEFEQGGGPQTEPEETIMRQCAATGCSYNQAGGCTLGAIEINDRGGCEQYEAAADQNTGGEDGPRYDEVETDVTGGTETPYQQEEDDGEERHWETGRLDPKGPAY